jgi:ketosteroid isomerase-like protein
MQGTPQIMPERVANAYDALASGDLERIREFWADDMVWLVPGHNPLPGQRWAASPGTAFAWTGRR